MQRSESLLILVQEILIVLQCELHKVPNPCRVVIRNLIMPAHLLQLPLPITPLLRPDRLSTWRRIISSKTLTSPVYRPSTRGRRRLRCDHGLCLPWCNGAEPEYERPFVRNSHLAVQCCRPIACCGSNVFALLTGRPGRRRLYCLWDGGIVLHASPSPTGEKVLAILVPFL